LDRIYRSFGTLEKVLETRTFLVGERITLADITVAAVVQRAAVFSLDATTRIKYPSLIRLVETVANHPALKEIYGPVEFPEKILAYVAPVKEKKKDDKPKPAQAPKAEKPKKEEKPKEVDPEEDDDLVPEEPKAKNPLDFLPKSTFNLEDWKRAYSNMDTRGPGGSIEWFYEQFVSSGSMILIFG
jgi:elongation factor 1-gamma